MQQADRWPPVYDAEELRQAIRQLSTHNEITKNFYGAQSNGNPFQGDIIQLESPIPVIWKDGAPAVQGQFKYWLIIGNTCDLHRNAQDTEFTQIIPIIPVDGSSVTLEQKQKFLTYAYYRRFYLPPWNEETKDSVFFADFLKPVAIHKKAIQDHTTNIATLRFHSWLLLNSCLVRFLARDDGRFD